MEKVSVDPNVFKMIQQEIPYTSTIIKKSQSPDGTKIVTLTNNGRVSLWDGKTGKSLEFSLALDKENAQSMGFHPEGTKVIIKIGNKIE